MKKRIISLTLALLMVLSLAACGGKPTPTEAPTTVTTEPTEAPTEAPTVAPTQAPTEAPTTEAPTEAPTEPENALALGVVEGNTYYNTYAGIGCELDSTWTIIGADQLQELPDIAQEMFEGTELEEAMADVIQFTDMYAENVELLSTVNVLFQKLDMSQRIAYAGLDEKDVLEVTLQQQDAMIQAYAQNGIQVESFEIVTVNFLGEEHYALKTVAETKGVAYYCLQTFDFWLGQYSATITFASYAEDNTEALLELFYAVE